MVHILGSLSNIKIYRALFSLGRDRWRHGPLGATAGAFRAGLPLPGLRLCPAAPQRAPQALQGPKAAGEGPAAGEQRGRRGLSG